MANLLKKTLFTVVGGSILLLLAGKAFQQYSIENYERDRNYEYSLKQVGLSPNEVILEKNCKDYIGNDGIEDYKILVENPDKTYSEKIIRGYVKPSN